MKPNSGVHTADNPTAVEYDKEAAPTSLADDVSLAFTRDGLSFTGKYQRHLTHLLL